MTVEIRKIILYALMLATVTGCSAMGELAQDILTTPETKQRRAQSDFDDAQSSIELRARQGAISWVQAVKELRETDRSMARSHKSSWKYNSDDEEYYAYCLQLAERLDRKQITYAQFDSARIQRFNQISARRQQLDEQRRQTDIQRENQKISEQQKRQEELNRNRSLNCTSSVIAGQIYTSCY